MAIPDSVQTLSAAFSFGILLQAATGALFLYYKANDSNFLQDGRRLVLMLFMLFAALWAQISFINLMVTASSTTCQALLAFSTAFDQLARVAALQFFLWAMSEGKKTTATQMVLQGILGIRLIFGGILVGLTRPVFSPVCVAQTSVLPIAIVVLGLDFVIIGVSIIRIFSMGIFNDLRVAGKSTRREQSRALIFSVLAFGVWIGTSVPMILGVPTIPLIAKTVAPANGLLLLVAILTIFPGALLSKREDENITPEAQSPFAITGPATREIYGENVDNGPLISRQTYSKNGGLSVVNPPMPTARFSRSSNFKDTRGFTKHDDELSVRGVELEGSQSSAPKGGRGYRGSSGVFPSSFSGSQFGDPAAMRPQIISNGRPRKDSNPSAVTPGTQKWGMFSAWSKSPAKPTIRNLGISAPVIDNADANTNQKVPTIDLATAAIQERQRREEAAVRDRLVGSQPTPDLPAQDAVAALRRSISLKRKEAPGRLNAPMPAIPGSVSSALSVDEDSASTTSTSLSPGHEEVRRRSPRNSKSFEPSATDYPATKPLLQRQGTIGLPSNPRAVAQAMTRKPSVDQDPKIMFVKEIVYDNPAMVNEIMSAAPIRTTFAERPKTDGTFGHTSQAPSFAALSSSNSILHRPRPYRRDSETDRAIFPSESPVNHNRSKSGPSGILTKLMLSFRPGSPSDLPPLPPPPTSAMKLRRILPNDTKSMTLDEKIEMLFPAPPGMVGPAIPNRRSSVPSLPRLPSQFVLDAAPQISDFDSRRSSKRTTIASFALLDLKSRPPSPVQAPQIPEKAARRESYRFSADSSRNVADNVGETWIPGISGRPGDIPNSVHGPTKTYDGRKSTWTEYTSSDESSQRDSVAYWGSVHSHAAVDISKSRRNARSSFIRSKITDSKEFPPVPPIEYNGQDQIMTVMLDTQETHLPILSLPNRQSFILDDGQSLPKALPEAQVENGWHRRIGDELPTFSERRTTAKARKMPPPPPLLLNSSGRAATVVVHAAEPSPIDSAESALQEIQAQLKRFEGPTRDSVESIFRRLPNVANDENEFDQGNRLRLLENLEKEMGQQEDQWQQMQNNLDRDSMSVISPQTSVLSDGELSRRSSIRSSRNLSLAASRRERIRIMRSKRGDSNSTTSTRSSDDSKASVWQQRLAEAQVEYLEKAPQLLRKKSLNFLSISMSHQLGSPTPPESVDSGTDLSSDSDSEREGDNMGPREWPTSLIASAPVSLWENTVKLPKATSGSMWSPSYETISRVMLSEPPAKDLRPAQRPGGSALSISSFQLWSKPKTPEDKRAVTGLWGSKPVRPRSIATRRATQRPQRKSKRLTILPDIIESPVPLPNKRDTLGIYQFPWGEKSDNAVYQPPFNPAAIAGPLMSTKFQERSEQLEPDLDEYSASYFDDYDEGDDSSDISTESDDEFDETTLWEIAGLLQSTEVPSKNSLLPPPRQMNWSEEAFGDYDEEGGHEKGFLKRDKKANQALPLPPQPLAMTSTNGLTRSKPRISENLSNESHDLRKGPAVYSPASVTSSIWQAERPKQTSRSAPGALMSLMREAEPAVEVLRVPQAAPAALNMVKTSHSNNVTLLELSSSSMWSPKQKSSKAVEWISVSAPNVKAIVLPNKMWSPAKSEPDVVSRSNYFLPAALNMTRKPRTAQLPLSVLSSNQLWSGCQGTQTERDWISESSVRPESPSIYSASSSGQSSPLSDASSIKSTSTKASSIWGSLGSATTWSLKKAPSSSPMEASKHPSNAPLKQTWRKAELLKAEPEDSKISATGKGLAPLRESRVLTSRDLFEAKILNLNTAPIQKLQKAVKPNTPVAKPLGRQHQLVVANPPTWEAALREAVAAGKPKRKVTTATDWKAALEVAISGSRMHFRRPIASPAMWKAALEEAMTSSIAVDIATALTYDSSIRHPVFFTEKLISTGSEIHPAAIGYYVVSRKSSMWVPPATIQAAATSTLWSKKNVIQDMTPPLFAIANQATVRMPSTEGIVRSSAKSIDLPFLESSKLWQPPQAIAAQQNWFTKQTSKLVKSHTWSPQEMPSAPKNNAMWSISANAMSLQGQDVFAHFKSEPLKKAASAQVVTLPILQTAELFQAQSTNDTENIHCLHVTSKATKTTSSISLPVPTGSVLTWTASVPSAPAKEDSLMWESSPTNVLKPASLFVNPHTDPWQHKKRELAPIESVKSYELWRQYNKIPASPTHWLAKRKPINKVEFRY